MTGSLLRGLLVLAIGFEAFAPLGARGELPPAARAAAAAVPPQSANTWMNVTGSLAGMASECGNLTLLSSMPNSNTIIAGVAGRGLWANSSGSAWSHLGDNAGSATITNRPTWITYDPSYPGTFWESGIYDGGGVFKTTNSGGMFQQQGSVTHNDFVSVDFNDPDRQTLLAGGHEQSRTVHRSTDGGQTWTNIGVTLPANTRNSGNPLIINSRTYLINSPGSGGAGFGIYRTTNGGGSWQQVSALGPSGPPLVSLSGAIYWSFNGGVLKSTDSGVTWTEVRANLQTVPPIELSNGRLISIGASNLMISADGGSTWSAIGPTLPFTPSGLIYSPRRQAFFIWRGDCGSVVLPSAVMRLGILG